MELYLIQPYWYGWAVLANSPGDILRGSPRSELDPRLAAMVGVPQEALFHPEGDVFEHTACVCDAMKAICERENITGARRLTYMLTALCHDMGKAKTTVRKEKNGVLCWAAPGHDVAGVPLAEGFLLTQAAEPPVVEMVLPLVRWHMTHTRKDGWSAKSVRKLARNLAPASMNDLLLVMEADCSGRPPLPGGLPPSCGGLIETARSLGLVEGHGVWNVRSHQPDREGHDEPVQGEGCQFVRE